MSAAANGCYEKELTHENVRSSLEGSGRAGALLFAQAIERVSLRARVQGVLEERLFREATSVERG